MGDPKLIEIRDRLVRNFNPLALYLFGSRARQEAVPGSDYDLLMVIESSTDPMYKRIQKVRPVLRGLGVPIDILVMTKEEFSGQADVVSSLPATVLREGKRLHAA